MRRIVNQLLNTGLLNIEGRISYPLQLAAPEQINIRKVVSGGDIGGNLKLRPKQVGTDKKDTLGILEKFGLFLHQPNEVVGIVAGY